jgi:hypothetical protein
MKLLSVVVALLLATICLMVAAAIHEKKQWEVFRTAHACKIVAQVSGSSTTAIGFSSSGSMTVTPIAIPAKTGWLCDDGVTYYR